MWGGATSLLLELNPIPLTASVQRRATSKWWSRRAENPLRQCRGVGTVCLSRSMQVATSQASLVAGMHPGDGFSYYWNSHQPTTDIEAFAEGVSVLLLLSYNSLSRISICGLRP